MKRVAKVESEVAHVRDITGGMAFGLSPDISIHDFPDLAILLLSEEARDKLRPGAVLNVTIEIKMEGEGERKRQPKIGLDDQLPGKPGGHPDGL